VDVINPPAGCPNLLVWNGTAFVDQGLLNIHNLVNPDSDVDRAFTLNTTPALIDDSWYGLELYEHPPGYNVSHSWINQVMLYAVDTNGVWHQCILVFAYEVSTNRSRCGNVLPLLLYNDTKWAQTYYGDKIFLLFEAPYVHETAYFANVLPMDIRNDTRLAQAYYGDRICLLFQAAHVPDIDHFVFVIIGHNRKGGA
jgi:hypothetical protein